MNKKPWSGIWILSVLILAAGMACNGVTSTLQAGQASSKPHAGKWAAQVKYKTSGGDEMTWALSFTVSDDAKQITQAQVMHYLGELAPDTEATVLMALQPVDIENNSFSISFSELSNYSMRTYKFKGNFASASRADGTLAIGDTTYPFTAAPAEQ